MKPSLFHGNLVNSKRILYTPSEFAKTNLIHLQEVGELQAQTPHVSSRNGLSSYLFFVVTEGSGTLQYDGNNYVVPSGSCVFIDCRKPYSHCSSKDLWKLHWVHFYGPNMAGIYQKYKERGGHPCFSTNHMNEYLQLLDNIYNIASSSFYVKDMKIFEKLTALLTLLMEDSWSSGKNKTKNPVGKRDLQDIKNYLDIHFTEKIMLEDLSEKFFINKYYLTRVFKEQFGISIGSYLLQQRVTQAKQMLRFTDHSIEFIATQCGMPDANYFARAFKKLEGITPGEYRKQW